MKVAKFPGEAAERIARVILADGPATAPEIARGLGLTPAAVRRTLSSLVHAGLVESSERPPFGPSPVRGRGRPGHIFSLTDAGRAALSQAYDGLALAALRFLERTSGRDSVAAFAQHWAESSVPTGGDGSAPGEDSDAITVDALARALDEAGYAVAVQPLGAGFVQLCQHACPVSDAATEFPELCEAEADAMSAALGRHVTRLATIAHGDGVCTTLIPTDPANAGSSAVRRERHDRYPAGQAREVMA